MQFPHSFLALLAGVVASCSSVPRPGSMAPLKSEVQAEEILAEAAKAHGDPWKQHRKVTVKYDGKWAPLVNRIQPDLIDANFRKISTEIYDTRRKTVRQIHQAPGGTKEVFRNRKAVTVTYNGKPNTDQAKKDAAALVADAYTAFLFGPSWMKEHATGLEVVTSAKLNGRDCLRLQGKLKPGFGFSAEDDFIMWIDAESKLCRRLQFTLEGLESTQGSDVSVTFSKFVKTADGSIWPTRFLEWVERPVHLKAHEWDLLELKADGQHSAQIQSPVSLLLTTHRDRHKD